MNQRILWAIFLLCLYSAPKSVAYAWQETPSIQGDALTGEFISGPAARASKVPVPQEAYGAMIAEGTMEGGLIWNLTQAGTLTISGSGAMPEMASAEEQPWRDNSSRIRRVVVGDGVTSIGSSAFKDCGVLTAEIPSSVKTIGSSAFSGSLLISVTIPSSVETIGDSAFSGCQSLSSVTVSEGAVAIGPNAFRSCTSLTSIALPASIEEVGDAAFFQCTALKRVLFASGSKQVKMGGNMFTQCRNLRGVALPENIDRISEGMFQDCRALAGVEIPQGAVSIGANAFSSCSSMDTVIIPDSVTTIGIAAFASCPLENIYFTGTEAQWEGISKIDDTASATSKAAMHYNYIPSVTRPDDGVTGTVDAPVKVAAAQTGDESALQIHVALFLLSAGLMAVIYQKRKRKSAIRQVLQEPSAFHTVRCKNNYR